jgi:hypothetical protein
MQRAEISLRNRRTDVNYQLKGTSRTPALTIFLIDVSASMNLPLGDKTRIEVVTDALQSILRRMVFLCTRGNKISPRYHVAIYAYTDQVYSLLDGIQSIDQVAAKGVPKLMPQATTNTALGFAKVEELLKNEIHKYARCPAPVVCHLTDGEFTGDDPEPVVRRIMQMSVVDGPVLVENIFMSDTVLPNPIIDVRQWPGILPGTQLGSDYARKLRAMSSTLPESYREMMEEMDYHISPNASMLLPGTSPELVQMAFAMATTTK